MAGISTNASSIERQLDTIFKHTRIGSYRTRFRYRDSVRLFSKFVNDKFKLQNARNINDKHVVAFVQHRQDNGISTKTIKNDLAAIRYAHDQVARVRFDIPSNADLVAKHGIKFDKISQITGNKAWTEQEYKDFRRLATKMGNQKASDILTLCREQGLRISEATSLHRSQAENALRSGTLTVKGKGGKIRDMPLRAEGRAVFERIIPETPRGRELFVDREQQETVAQVIQNTQNFITNYREEVTTDEGMEQRYNYNLTAHGLRYAYIQERVQEEIDKGYSHKQACHIVTKEVGHERTEIIEIYLARKG